MMLVRASRCSISRSGSILFVFANLRTIGRCHSIVQVPVVLRSFGSAGSACNNNDLDVNNNGSRSNAWPIIGLSDLNSSTSPSHPDLLWYFDDISNHRKLFDSAAREIGLRTLEDWYQIKLDDDNVVRRSNSIRGVASLLSKHYDNSLSKALLRVYPEHEWIPWRFSSGVPSGFWQNEANHRKFFDWAADRLGIASNSPEQWYAVKSKSIKQIGGAGLLSKYYGNSLWRALSRVYPELDFVPWRFASGLPHDFWEDSANRRKFFGWAAQQLFDHRNNAQERKQQQQQQQQQQQEQQDDQLRLEYWYQVKLEDIEKLGGGPLLSRYYNNSLWQALADVYPDVAWVPWKFASGVPSGFWADKANHRKFFDWAAQQLGINSGRNPDHWYEVQLSDIKRLRGGGLLASYYGNSLWKALSAVYPEVDFLPWRFSSLPSAFWAEMKNKRGFLDWVAKQLLVQQPEDWYQVRLEHIKKLAGCSLAPLWSQYNNSLWRTLSSVYPEYHLLPWKFSTGVPSGFWADVANHRVFFDWAAQQLGVQKPEDWCRVRVEDVARLGGGGLIYSYYDNSMFKALSSVYPDVDWMPWRFTTGVPRGYWSSIANQRKFFDWAATKLGIDISNNPDRWYEIKIEDITRLGGAGLLATHYESSVSSALSTIYPEHELVPWKFASGVPKGFWQDEANRKRFFDWAAKQLNVRTPSDWFKVSLHDIKNLRGGALLSAYYNNSLEKALQSLYPDLELVAWEHPDGVPYGYWTDDANRRKFFDWAAKKLQIRTHEDWYRVQAEDVCKMGAAGFLQSYYGGSLHRALSAVYPDVDWQPWRFRRRPCLGLSGNDDDHKDHPEEADASRVAELRRYIEFLQKELHIEQHEDWYRVSFERDIRQLGGSSIVTQHGGLYLVLKTLYPEYPWVEEKFHTSRGKKSAQRWLKVLVQRLFPNQEIVEEYIHPDVRLHGEGDEAITLDLWYLLLNVQVYKPATNNNNNNDDDDKPTTN